jgi:hypothetical protein
MNLSRETAHGRLVQITRYLTVSAVVAGIFLLLLRALVHYPFFDESIHVRYLWMISSGMKPGIDFFSAYPVLAYLFIEPFFKSFPESAYVLLALRFLSIFVFAAMGVVLYNHGQSVAKDWTVALSPLVLLAASGNVGPFMVEFSIDHYAALAAVGAMALFFRDPKPLNIGAAAALCLLSVAITPKYALPLFFGLVGYAAAGWLSRRQTKQLAIALGAGAMAATLLVILAYALFEVSLIENIKMAHIIGSKIQLGKHGDVLAMDVFSNFLKRPLLGAVLLLGAAGWAKRSWRKKDATALAGAGILLGIIIYCLRIRFPLEQYQTPVYVSLALFVPFGMTIFSGDTAAKIARGLLAAGVLAVALGQIPSVGSEFRQTSLNFRDADKPGVVNSPCGLAALANMESLLERIPRDEPVIAMWIHNPFFRKDIADMMADDRPSFTKIIDRNDPLYRFFDPAILQAELRKSPPAFIDTIMLETNYPPGWDKIVKDYVAANMNLYQPVPSPVLKGFGYFIRKDLMNR